MSKEQEDERIDEQEETETFICEGCGEGFTLTEDEVADGADTEMCESCLTLGPDVDPEEENERDIDDEIADLEREEEEESEEEEEAEKEEEKKA